MSTPRERIEAYLEKCNATECEPDLQVQDDIRAVLAANAGYEQITRTASSQAVREYKTSLAAELRSRAQQNPGGETYEEVVLERIADDLEDGTL